MPIEIQTLKSRSVYSFFIKNLLALSFFFLCQYCAYGQTRSEIAEIMFANAINEHRADNGLAPLCRSVLMDQGALNWTFEMASAEKLEHAEDITEGNPPGSLGGAENVGRGGTASGLMIAFKNSPGHNSTLLNARYTHMGIGVYVTDKNVMYTTHRFTEIPVNTPVDCSFPEPLECDPPSSTQNSTTFVTATSATLNTISGFQSYDWQYRQQGGDWSEATNRSPNTLEISTLLENVLYEWRVRVTCSNGVESEWSMIKTFITLPAPTCGRGNFSDYATTDIMTNGASFKINLTGNSYAWRYRENGSSEFTVLPTMSQNTISVTGLLDNTGYEWQGKRRCPNNVWSDWSTSIFFTTDEIIVAGITVEKPLSGSNHIQGSQLFIDWTSIGVTGNVELNLFRNGSFLWQFTPNTSNMDMEHLVTIPMSIETGDGYSVEVKPQDGAPSGFSSVFSIGDQNSSIDIEYPAFRDVLEKGKPYEYRWTHTGQVGNVKVELFNNGSLAHTHTTNTLNDGEHVFQIPNSLIESDNYTIKISELSGDIYDVSDEFTIQNEMIQGPDRFIIFTNPTSNNQLSQGESLSVQWDDNIDDPLLLSLYREEENGAVQVTAPISIPANREFAIFDIPSNLPSGIYKFRLSWNVSGATVVGVNSERFPIGAGLQNVLSTSSNNARGISSKAIDIPDSSYTIKRTPDGSDIVLQGDFSASLLHIVDVDGNLISSYDNSRSMILIKTSILGSGQYYLNILSMINPGQEILINLD